MEALLSQLLSLGEEELASLLPLLIASVVGAKDAPNATGKELVLTVGGHLGNQAQGPATFVFPLNTPLELVGAQTVISVLDRIDRVPDDGKVELEAEIKTPKISLLFIKITLKGDVEVTLAIQDVPAA